MSEEEKSSGKKEGSGREKPRAKDELNLRKRGGRKRADGGGAEDGVTEKSELGSDQEASLMGLSQLSTGLSRAVSSEAVSRLGRRLLGMPTKAKSEMSMGLGRGPKRRKTMSPNEAWVPECVREADYYHGMIHKDELRALLKRDGDFLIRLGRSVLAANRVTLTVLWEGKLRHFILQWIGVGSKRKVWLEMERQFGDETKLVDYHVETGTPLGERKVVLRYPVTHQPWELELADIELEKEIGSGAFGKVWAGRLDLGNRKARVAVKLCESTQLSLSAQSVFMKEAEIGRRLSHPNVVSCYGVQHRQEPLMIVMELAEGGGLLRRLKTPPPAQPSPGQLLGWSRQACAALEYLEQKKIIHRDIAARNCLLGPSPSYILKLADFGLAKADLATYKMKTQTKMAPRWMAPEVMMAGEFSFASEVWAFGVLLWEIYSKGDTPFKGYAAVEIKERVCGRERLRLALPVGLRPELGQLMERCWASRPQDRPTIARIGLDLDRLLGCLPQRLCAPAASSQPQSAREDDDDVPAPNPNLPPRPTLRSHAPHNPRPDQHPH